MLGAKDDVGDGFDAGDGLVACDQVDDVVEGRRVARLRGWRVGWQGSGCRCAGLGRGWLWWFL